MGTDKHRSSRPDQDCARRHEDHRLGNPGTGWPSPCVLGRPGELECLVAGTLLAASAGILLIPNSLNTTLNNWRLSAPPPIRFSDRSRAVRSTTDENRIENRLLMPDLAKVRLDSQDCAVYGSCTVCVLAWTSHTPLGLVPHSERLYAKGSRSAGTDGVERLRWFYGVPGGAPNDDRGFRRCFLCV